jgi:NitT/TauT family transport system substrate-binding protein
MKHQSNPYAGALGLLAFLLALSLAACAPAAPAAPSGKTPEAPVKLKVNLQPYIGYAPILIAKEEGYFAKYGMEVEFVEAPAADALPLVMQGQLDILLTSTSTGIFNAISRAGTGRIVMGLSRWGTNDCASTSILGDRKQIAILRNVAGWKGLIISTNATGAQGMQGFFLSQVLATGGLTLGDVEIRKLDAPAAIQALQSGAAPLALTTEPWSTRVVTAGDAEILHGAQQILPNAQYSVVVFSERLLRSPDLGKRAALAFQEAVRQYQEGPTDRNIKIIGGYTGLEPEILKQICWATIPVDGAIDLPSIMAFQQWAAAEGSLDRVVGPEEFWDGRFVEALGATPVK